MDLLVSVLKPIKTEKKTVYEQIVHVIRSSILKGELKPGDKLPSERELSSILNVSRASVREAIRMLAAEGLVKVKHGQGIFINKQDNPDFIIHKLNKVSMDEKMVKEFFEVRVVLELQAVEWAIQRASDEELHNLKDLIHKARKKLNEKKGVLLTLAEHDNKFHEMLAEMTKNRVLVKSMHSLLDILSEVRLKCLKIEGRPVKSLDEHERIVNALLARDIKEAKKAMKEHIISVERDVLRYFYA